MLSKQQRPVLAAAGVVSSLERSLDVNEVVRDDVES